MNKEKVIKELSKKYPGKKIIKDSEENLPHPSLRLHKLHGKFKGFWSIFITSS